jgi:thiamine-phosphate pyrophosphorylase
MPLEQKRPLTYLVTSGKTTLQTTPNSQEFTKLLKLVEAAVASGVSLVQIREKNLGTRVLEELAKRAVDLTRGSVTRLLINERFDVASASGADGVQLTSRSIPTEVVRSLVGKEFLIGVSTHSLGEVLRARDQGADFVLFGPVFETESKLAFGPPQGLSTLQEVTSEAGSFPVIAIGGVTEENATHCFEAGAAGVAAISWFEDLLLGPRASSPAALHSNHP